MRLSANSDDPGHPAWRAMKRRGILPIVTVGGAIIRQCVTVDTKRGIVVANDLNDQGNAQLNSKRDAVRRKVITGKVSIEYARR